MNPKEKMAWASAHQKPRKGRPYVPDVVRLPGCRTERERRGWTVADLAQRAGIAWITADRADRGEPVSIKTLNAIVAALEQCEPSPIADALLGHEQTAPDEGSEA